VLYSFLGNAEELLGKILFPEQPDAMLNFLIIRIEGT
jgi:hypothetical protein